MLDPRIDVSDKLAQILREDEEKAKAVGRVPGQGPEETEEPKEPTS
jgi:hypothetical protein